MQPDRMGNHTNVKGVAVFRIAFDKQGRVIAPKRFPAIQ
jgi:hypothetical protein